MARVFNGTSDKITFSAPTLGTVHTIAFWMIYNNSADAVVIGGADNGGGDARYCPYISGPSSGASIFYRSTSNPNFVSVVHGGFTSGVWYHIAIVRNGTSVSFYKNGTQIGTTQTLGGNISMNAVTTLGNFSNGTLWFKGDLANVGFWTAALGSSDIAALAGGSTPYDVQNGSLVEDWLLFGPNGPEINLASGGGSGTLTGTTLAAPPTFSGYLIPLQCTPEPNRGTVSLTQTATFSATPTAGNSIVVMAKGLSAAVLGSSAVTDNQGNIYTQDVLKQDSLLNGEFVEIWHSSNIAASGTFTVTFTITGTAGILELAALEVNQNIALDQSGSATGSSTAPAAGSVTTGTAKELLVAVMAVKDTANPATVSSPGGFYSVDQELNGATYEVGDATFRVVDSTLTVNPTWTTGNFPWAAAVATYKVYTAPTAKLFRQSLLNGLGAGGDFFSNPIG